MFLLPDDKSTVKAAYSLSWHLERGALPAVDDYRARLRLKGRGQRIGHVASGRIRNLDYTQTAIKRELRFRDDRVAPKRKVKILVDLSAADSSISTQQLIGCTILVTCCILTLSGVSVALAPVGVADSVPERSFASPSEIRAIRETLGSWLKLRTATLNLGRLRFGLGDVAERHFILVTHFVPPRILQALECPLGLTTVLVAPRLRWGFSSGSGLVSGPFASSSATLVMEETDQLYATVCRSVQHRLGEVIRLSGEYDPIPSLRRALAEGSF